MSLLLGAFRRGLAQCKLKREFFAVGVHGCLLSAFPDPPKSDEDGSFTSAAAISSQDGARQACHGRPTRITSPSALHRAASRTEPVPAKVSNSCRVPTSQSLTASRPPTDVELN